MSESVAESNRGLAVALTIGYHGILFLVLFFFILKTPIPPLPEVGGGSGLEVNFGNSETGLGDNKSEELLNVETQNLSGSSDDKYITQDADKEETFTSKSNKVQTATVIKINDPVVDPSKLYKKKSNASQGVTSGSGNQGKLNGDVNSSNYTGDGGSGNGLYKGNGTGIGDGDGPGTSVDIKDRTTLYLPKPVYDSDEQGLVVVAITVDQDGKVTKAVAGAKGSTITDKALLKQSEQAAYKAKFNKKKNAAIEQKGTITYHFLKLN
jgi:TonB family protein